MANEEQVLNPDQPEDPEYRKPNPEDNPRNHVLAEIAKSVAATHAVDAAETVDSIDEEGNITPAKPPEVAAPIEETPVVEAAPAATPVPAETAETVPAAPDAVDPTKEYEVTVDGQKMKVKGSAIIDAGYRTFQKETAADFRLEMASELLREAEAKVRAAPEGAPPARQEAPADKTDAELSNQLQFGTPEQSAEAVKALRSRGMDPAQIGKLVSDQARFAAQDELKFQDAMNFVNTEYADLLKNDYVKRLFFVEENRRRAPRERGGEADTRSYKELYQAIGEDLRKSLSIPKPAGNASSTPTPPGTAAVRQARKAEAPPVPRTAATRLSEAAAAGKVPTPSEIIARMAEQRGKTQLRPSSKGP